MNDAIVRFGNIGQAHAKALARDGIDVSAALEQDPAVHSGK